MKLHIKPIARLTIVFLLLNILSVPVIIHSFIFPGNISTAEEILSFSDVPNDAWYYEDLQYILEDERKIFAGYPDGTFRPNDTLTVDMYIKLIVTIKGHKVENGREYWASTYIEKAVEEGYIIPWQDVHFTYKTKDDPYAGYRKPINRGDMALIAGRAFTEIADDDEYRDPIAVSSLIKDYYSLPSHIRASVVKFYDLGIFTGYPDGEFKPDNILTRAEAVAVIRRLIDPPARKKADLPVAANPSPTPIPVSELNRPPKKDLGNGVVEVEGIRFDPSTDIVNPSNGAMRILKAEEFVGVFLEYLTFYEHEGKARVRGYIPVLPDGYEWVIGIHYHFEGPDDRGLSGDTISMRSDAVPEKKLPRPGKSFDMPMYIDKNRIESLYLTFEIRTPKNASGGSFFISLTLNRYSRYDAIGGHSFVSDFDSGGFFEW